MSTGVGAELAGLSDTLDKLHMGYVQACNKVAVGRYEAAYEQYVLILTYSLKFIT